MAKTVLVKPGDPVQIRKSVAADVWVFDGAGQRTESRVVLPEGWYCLPDAGAKAPSLKINTNSNPCPGLRIPPEGSIPLDASWRVETTTPICIIDAGLTQDGRPVRPEAP